MKSGPTVKYPKSMAAMSLAIESVVANRTKNATVMCGQNSDGIMFYDIIGYDPKTQEIQPNEKTIDILKQLCDDLQILADNPDIKIHMLEENVGICIKFTNPASLCDVIEECYELDNLHAEEDTHINYTDPSIIPTLKLENETFSF